jgi:amidohydrolase
MDALPMQEHNEFAHKSTVPGKAHLCGHDMHTTILLGTARHLAHQRNTFKGKVNFIFQPAEEGQGGADKMIKDGLFERFPCDEIYGLHNWPMMPNGNINVTAGPIMASANEFDIEIRGKGGHAALPHGTDDSLLIGARIVDSLQSIVSRQIDPLEPAVLSVTSFHSAGNACNVIYESVKIRGTVRTFDDNVRDSILRKIEQVVKYTVEALGGDDSGYTLKIHGGGFPATVNSAEQAVYAAEAAVATVGTDRVTSDVPKTMGAEDFSFMLKKRPGCYVWIGGGYGKPMVHHPEYDADNQIMPVGVQFFSNIVKSRLGGGL